MKKRTPPRLKVVFMGTPDIAVSILDELVKHHDVICVYTREPAPAKRGKRLLASPVHERALELGIEVRHPGSLKPETVQQEFIALNADITVVCAYGFILPPAVLEAFPYQCINVHVSLLPKYRGAAPVERALLDGDVKTGVTIMKVAYELDAGDILQQREVNIPDDMNVVQLYQELAWVGASLVTDTISGMIAGTIIPVKQDESQVTFAHKIKKEEYRLDFARKAQDLHNLVRGVYPHAYFEYRGERIGVTESRYEAGNFGTPGTILDEGRAVACADGRLVLKRIKRAGKREMPVEDFLRGFSFAL